MSALEKRNPRRDTSSPVFDTKCSEYIWLRMSSFNYTLCACDMKTHRKSRMDGNTLIERKIHEIYQKVKFPLKERTWLKNVEAALFKSLGSFWALFQTWTKGAILYLRFSCLEISLVVEKQMKMKYSHRLSFESVLLLQLNLCNVDTSLLWTVDTFF